MGGVDRGAAPEPAHRIRLGLPWDSAPAPGGFRHVRRFGSPRTLPPGVRVWLVWDAPPAGTAAAVNGTPLAVPATPGMPLEVDVTDLLRPRNELVVWSPLAAPAAGVALEFRPGAGVPGPGPRPPSVRP